MGIRDFEDRVMDVLNNIIDRIEVLEQILLKKPIKNETNQLNPTRDNN